MRHHTPTATKPANSHVQHAAAEAGETVTGVVSASPRGSNQADMRAYNERLVLSLLRNHGALAKSDIARMTGLSAQTVSVIMRALEQEGLLQRGDPVRGKVGQPSVPMSLAADGAFFFGLKIGRRSVDLVLVDFLGNMRGARRQTYRYPTPDAVIEFASEALPALRNSLPEELRARVTGLGAAIPFQLWNWVALIGAPQSDMDSWRERDLAEELAELSGLPVYLQNDASSACGAELTFGNAERSKDFLYFYFGTFIGGGLAINGTLFLGRTGNAAGVGPMVVQGPDGQIRRLLDLASLSILAEAMDQAGLSSDHMWQSPENWDVPAEILEKWIEGAAAGLASAVLSTAALVEVEAVVIDGWMPASLRAAITEKTRTKLRGMDLAGIELPVIREGSVGPDARALGAAAVPLAQRYLLEHNSMVGAG